MTLQFNRILFLALLISSSILVYCFPTWGQTGPATHDIGSLEETVRFKGIATGARLRFQRAVDVPAPRSPELVEPSLDKAAAHYSSLIIEPYAKQTVVADNTLRTWFKCKLVETVSLVDRPPVPWAPLVDTLPSAVQPTALLPLSLDTEVLLPLAGGELTVDGVIISMTPPRSPAIVLGQQYLTFATVSEDRKVVTVPLEAKGMFLISGETLSSLSHDQVDTLALGMSSLHQSNLGQFRQHTSVQHRLDRR